MTANGGVVEGGYSSAELNIEGPGFGTVKRCIDGNRKEDETF